MQSVLPTRLVIDLPNWVGDQVMALPAVHRLVIGNAGGETTLHARPAGRRLFESLFPSAVVVASPFKASPIASARRPCGDGSRFDIGITLRHASRAKSSFSRAVARAPPRSSLMATRSPLRRSRPS